MTLLHQKLNQLSLTTMSRQLDQIASDAAARNLSFSQALESLADLELESRSQNAIERRFRLSRLEARHSIEGFNFKHHKSRMEIKARVVRLLDLEFLDKGTSVILIGNPGVGKTLLAKIIGWRACQANKRVLFSTAADMLNHLNASQIDHSPIRKLKLYTEPALLVIDELGYLTLDQQNVEPFLPGRFHAPQPQTFDDDYNEYRVLGLGQHPAQHDHCHCDRRPAGRKLRDLPARRR